MSNSTHPDLVRLERLADTLDSRFRLPGTSIRFGLDAVLGLFPGLGDVATLGPAIYFIWQGRQAGASKWAITRMLGNTGIDFVFGSIPILGDLFDIGFKSNRRNLAILKSDLETRQQVTA